MLTLLLLPEYRAQQTQRTRNRHRNEAEGLLIPPAECTILRVLGI